MFRLLARCKNAKNNYLPRARLLLILPHCTLNDTPVCTMTANHRRIQNLLTCIGFTKQYFLNVSAILAEYFSILVRGLLPRSYYTSTPIPVAERCKARVCGCSLAGIPSSNPVGGMSACLLWALCAVSLWSQRRADPPSREVLPTVVCHCLRSRSLMNEAALARVGLLRHRESKLHL